MLCKRELHFKCISCTEHLYLIGILHEHAHVNDIAKKGLSLMQYLKLNESGYMHYHACLFPTDTQGMAKEQTHVRLGSHFFNSPVCTQSVDLMEKFLLRVYNYNI